MLDKLTLGKVIVIASLLPTCFGLSSPASAQLADSPWPSFGNNARNTGLSKYEGAQTDSLKWKDEAVGPFVTTPIIGNNGTIYIFRREPYDGALLAFNPDGTRKWGTTVTGLKGFPAIDKNKTIYVAGNYRLFAFHPNDSLKWTFDPGEEIFSYPSIGKDGTIYFGTNNYLYAVNPDSTLKWRYNTKNTPTTPAIGPKGAIYVGSHDHNLYAITPAGSLKWRFETDDRINSTPAVDNDGTVYFGSDDSTLYAVNTRGDLQWKYETMGEIHASPSISSNGTVYIGSSDSYLYAIKANGSFKWRFETSDGIYNASAVGRGGIVYTVSSDGNLYSINPDGSLKWHYKMFDRGHANIASPSIGPSGTIYAGSSYSIYAFGGIPTADISFNTLSYQLGKSSIQFSWQSEQHASFSHYEIYRSREDSLSYEKVATTKNSNWTDPLSFRPVPSSIFYKVNIKNIWNRVTSRRNMEISLPQAQQPLDPDYDVIIDQNLQIKLNWDVPASAKIDHFNIYRSTGQDSMRLYDNVSGNQTYYIDSSDSLTHIQEDLYYQISAVNSYKQESTRSEKVRINRRKLTIPESYALNKNYPNPFNPITHISFELPQDSHVQLQIYSRTGKLIRILLDTNKDKGIHIIKFNAENLSSGTYLYHLKAGNFQQTRKMTLIK